MKKNLFNLVLFLSFGLTLFGSQGGTFVPEEEDTFGALPTTFNKPLRRVTYTGNQRREVKRAPFSCAPLTTGKKHTTRLEKLLPSPDETTKDPEKSAFFPVQKQPTKDRTSHVFRGSCYSLKQHYSLFTLPPSKAPSPVEQERQEQELTKLYKVALEEGIKMNSKLEDAKAALASGLLTLEHIEQFIKTIKKQREDKNRIPFKPTKTSKEKSKVTFCLEKNTVKEYKPTIEEYLYMHGAYIKDYKTGQLHEDDHGKAIPKKLWLRVIQRKSEEEISAIMQKAQLNEFGQFDWEVSLQSLDVLEEI